MMVPTQASASLVELLNLLKCGRLQNREDRRERSVARREKRALRKVPHANSSMPVVCYFIGFPCFMQSCASVYAIDGMEVFCYLRTHRLRCPDLMVCKFS
jgi:hypothetical protein